MLKEAGVSFQQYEHPPCASSEESALARKEAGAGDTIGAKAILVRSKKGDYSVLVFPGGERLDSKKARRVVGKHSFATESQMMSVAGGIRPGHMPPFGPQLFDGIDELIIDPSLTEAESIGFNAGTPTTSIVLSGIDYIKACGSECSVIEIIS